MFYIELFRVLREEGVRYLVTGGLAMNLHGIPRMTADVDLFVELGENNIRKFLAAMRALGFSPAVPVPPEALADPAERSRWRREKNMVVLTFKSAKRPALAIDVFIEEPMPFDSAYDRRKRVYAENGKLEIPVVGEADLISMKERSGRQQDLSDIDALRRIQKGDA
ncbi:MAG: hypothetical protein A2X88_05515 [Deltaproteobacteria bacterium GWC2_65_14]|nr:MAG: hypothetical protein A2X88_05515 [Deltaproteobacteria bacterium GWC2_65_14]